MRVLKISIVGSISVLCTLLLVGPDGVNKNVFPGTNVMDNVVCNDIYRAMNQIRFVENRGQHPPEVLYSARLANGNVFFCRDSIVFHLRFRTKDNPTSTKIPIVNTAGFSRKRMHEPGAMDSSESHVITIRYTGSQRGSAPKGLSERTERVNIFEGSDPSSWIRDISTFDTLLYKEIYPGIDLYFFDTGNRLKYEFRVQPFTPYQDIQVQYFGIDSLSLHESGDAIAFIGSQTFIEKSPIAFQIDKRGNIDRSTGFSQTSRTALSYRIMDYDSSLALVIDPLYSTLIGGSNRETFSSIFVNADGIVYLAGVTQSDDFPFTSGSFDSTFSSDWDGCIIACDPKRNKILFSTFVGGSKFDFIRSIQYQSNGNIVVAGSTDSPDFPATDKSIQPRLSGKQDCFVAVLDSMCSSLAYSTFVGGSGFEDLFDMTTDSLDNIYITGLTDSRNYPRTSGAYQTNYGGGEDDVFITKLNADLSRYIFSTFLGGSDYDEGYCIRVDSSFNVYVAGLTSSYNFPVSADAIQPENNWSDEGFFAIFDSSGHRLKYSTYFGGNSADLIETLIIDREGNIIISGITMSTNLPVTPGVVQSRKSVSTFLGVDFFLAKYSMVENRIVLCTYLGGTSDELSWSKITIIGDNILLIGRTFSSDFPLAFPIQTENAGETDIVLTLINENVSRLMFSTYFGGAKWDAIYDCFLADGKLYLTGLTESDNYPLTSHNLQDSLRGPTDGVLTIFDLSKLTTSVKEMDVLRPLELTVSNYPNPFSSSGTTISYEIATASPVSLSVFNSAGQMIHKREWPRLAVGKHVYQYHGNGIPPGVYFYTLQIGKEQTTRKMVKVE